jgi:mono/diheme cytochrome c family protein
MSSYFRRSAGQTASIAFAAVTLALAAPGARAGDALVTRGEYLARAGDCISCHTTTGGAPFAGGYRLDTPFGYMLAPNITPDPETGIGAWTSDDFFHALHHGINRRGQDMYPTMPYDFYTRATRADIDAIYAYLRTVSPVRNKVDVNHLHFPFDQRFTMGAWRELYFREGTMREDPAKSAAWNRGAYLVEGFGHCSDCHSPRNLLGGIEKRRDFEGAVVDGWFALDLTSDIATGLGAWSESPLRTGRVRPDPGRAAAAKSYLDHCGGCHQAGGRGIAGVFPPLAGNGVVVAADPADILKVVLQGIPAQNQRVPMPSFAGQLDDGEIAAIANYLRTSWGNAAAPNATAAAVAKLRSEAR